MKLDYNLLKTGQCVTLFFLQNSFIGFTFTIFVIHHYTVHLKISNIVGNYKGDFWIEILGHNEPIRFWVFPKYFPNRRKVMVDFCFGCFFPEFFLRGSFRNLLSLLPVIIGDNYRNFRTNSKPQWFFKETILLTESFLKIY